MTMDSGFYAACAGLRARSQALEIVANNLANLNTTGYRAHETTFRSLLARNASANSNALNRAVNDFGVLGGTRVDLHAGNLESTGNALNFALEGDGFFTIQHQGQTFYTRDGNFRVSPSGQLITGEGDFVLGEQGPISVPSGQAAMGADGTLSVDGAVAGKLRLTAFAEGVTLSAAGASMYAADKGAAPIPSTASVRQGMLESSNVNPIAAAVGLITVQREAEMLQRALSTFYSEFNRIAATDLARV
jgi:flagellar basal-body rod protein FlgF/flagellar basal-body rod protein FlgG